MAVSEILGNNYFSADESTQFAFFRIPKDLFFNPAYREGLTTDAKLLYGIILDRMELSRKNGWVDDAGRVYIIYTIAEICETMLCGKTKAVELMAELEKMNLIKKKKRQHLPAIIYPCRAASVYTDRKPKAQTSEKQTSGIQTSEKRTSEIQTSEFQTSEKQTSEFQTSEFQTSRSSESEPPEVRNSNSNNTDFSDTDFNKTERQKDTTAHEGVYNADAVREHFRRQLEAERLAETYGEGCVNEVIELLTDTVCSAAAEMYICRQPISLDVIRSRFLKLTTEQVDKTLYTMRHNSKSIRNIHAYLLSALYRAPTETELFWDAKASYDLRNGKLSGKSKDLPTVEKMPEHESAVDDLRRWRQEHPLAVAGGEDN